MLGHSESFCFHLMTVGTSQARECFKSLDEAGLRAPIPFSYGKVGDDERHMTAFRVSFWVLDNRLWFDVPNFN